MVLAPADPVDLSLSPCGVARVRRRPSAVVLRAPTLRLPPQEPPPPPPEEEEEEEERRAVACTRAAARGCVSPRPPTPLATTVARAEGFTYAAEVCALSVVQGFLVSVAPCQTLLQSDSQNCLHRCAGGTMYASSTLTCHTCAGMMQVQCEHAQCLKWRRLDREGLANADQAAPWCVVCEG
jgi:hypothetical protein